MRIIIIQKVIVAVCGGLTIKTPDYQINGENTGLNLLAVVSKLG